MNNEYKTIAGTDYPVEGLGIKKNYELVKLREEWKNTEIAKHFKPLEFIVADWWIDKMGNQLQETSLDQYAMGQSEGMEYHEFKIKELKEKVEKYEFKMDIKDYLPKVKAWQGGYDVPFDDGYAQAKSDILNLLSSK